MSNLGLITEYNPFHNGHLYHLQKSKELFDSDNVICVMSGNFIQRGMPALTDKFTRAKMAVANGVNLVIELPTYFAVSSAEGFAFGSVFLLNSLGIINNLCFGSEIGDISILDKIADILVNEPGEYKKLLNLELNKGLVFPKARENAIDTFTHGEFQGILASPNNILGIEYLKALKKLNSNIIPATIKRIKADYNSFDIVENFASATAIRELLQNHEFEKCKDVLPNSFYDILENKNLVFWDSLSDILLYKLRIMDIGEIEKIIGVSEGLQNRIKKASYNSTNIYELIDNLKSKRYTHTRISRILINALLDIKKKDLEDAKYPRYIRILGFDDKGKELLKQISKKATLPLVTSVSKYLSCCDEIGTKMIRKDILASNVYSILDKSEGNKDYYNRF